MCQKAHPHNHATPHVHNHAEGGRREFFTKLLGGGLAGASILEMGFFRAAAARAQSSLTATKLFDIQKVAEGAYLAVARAQNVINSNTAIFVQSDGVLIVDSHSKPSAAAALVAQIKREVTTKPVRYLVNTHFHWDHTQGNSTYKALSPKVEILATNQTKLMMQQEVPKRLKKQIEQDLPQRIAELKTRMGKSTSAREKAFCQEQIGQIEAYITELGKFQLELPTTTFDTSHLIKDSAHDLHIEFHGKAHTTGDVVVYCPQKKVVATGDMIHGWLPFMDDGFPRLWSKTMDSVASRDFDRVMPGHGPLHQGKGRLRNQRNYIEELTARVEAGKKAGQSLAELQKVITVASLKSLQADGYLAFLSTNLNNRPALATKPIIQDELNRNTSAVYANLDKA